MQYHNEEKSKGNEPGRLQSMGSLESDTTE